MEDWIRTVLAHADELRAAGVLSIGPDSATFAPWVAPVAPDDKREVFEEEELDPLHDPATYGGRVPGYHIDRIKEPDE